MPYKNPAALRTALEVRLRNEAREQGVNLDRLRRRAVFERLLIRLEVTGPGIWVLKGGTALEVRWRERARTTKDLDLALRERPADGEALLELRLTAGDMSTKTIGSLLGQLDRSGPRVPMGEVVSLALDAVPVELDKTYHTAGIYSFGRGLFARPPITGTETKYKTLFRLQADQLVLSRLKAWEGAIAVVPADFQGRYVSQEYPTFDVNRKRAEPAYLRWLCRWDTFWKALLAQSKGLGARRDRVHPERLLATQIPLPPLEEQRRLTRIATTMDELDEIIRSFDTTFKALEPSIVEAALDGRL